MGFYRLIRFDAASGSACLTCSALISGLLFKSSQRASETTTVEAEWIILVDSWWQIGRESVLTLPLASPPLFELLRGFNFGSKNVNSEHTTALKRTFALWDSSSENWDLSQHVVAVMISHMQHGDHDDQFRPHPFIQKRSRRHSWLQIGSLSAFWGSLDWKIRDTTTRLWELKSALQSFAALLATSSFSH